jgi:hypothetical protein
VAYDLRNAIHRQLAGLSFSYHDRTETGQILPALSRTSSAFASSPAGPFFA